MNSGAERFNGLMAMIGIVAGLGADNIYGGAGIDAIDITEATSSADKLYFDSASTKYAATDGMTITGFTSADRLVITESKLTLLDFATNVTAGTEKTLITADYNEDAGTSGILIDEHVNIITTQGYADIAALLVATTETAANEMIVGFHNTTSGNYELYDTDTVGTSSTWILLASFTDITASTAADTFSEDNFILV